MKDKSSLAVTGRAARGGRFIPVFEPDTSWLLFKYDPDRQLIEIQRRGRKTLIDLARLDDKNPLDK